VKARPGRTADVDGEGEARPQGPVREAAVGERRDEVEGAHACAAPRDADVLRDPRRAGHFARGRDGPAGRQDRAHRAGIVDLLQRDEPHARRVEARPRRA
jgi:hypothetical protein